MYTLLPSPDIACKEENYAFWENGFSQFELSRLRKYGDGLIAENAKTDIGNDDPLIRKSKVAWIELEKETEWLYDKLGFIVRQINGQYFQFDLAGFGEAFQYTTYNGINEEHYDWHLDKGLGNAAAAPRKLSFVVMLSDPSEYEGGDLEIMTTNSIQRLDKTQGIIHFFPSWVLHRVTPVTAGSRRTLVVWVCGPKFK